MTKAAQRSRRRQKAGQHLDRSPRPRISDATLFLGFAIIGAFAVLVLSLATGVEWPQIALGYVAAIAILINLYAFRAYRGGRLEGWQQALARVPLRFVGYGSRGGKPLEAAHDHPETRKALIVSVVVSGIVLVILALIAIPELHGSR